MSSSSSAKEFEEFVRKSLKRKYPPKNGWEIKEQKQVRTPGPLCKADFLVQDEKRGEKIVVEAKAKKSLTTSDIRQIKEYKSKLRAQEAIFYIANGTDVPDTIAEAIKKSPGLSYQRTRYKSADLDIYTIGLPPGGL